MIIVCGPTGAGKTTYSIALCKQIDAVRFSIDPWMQTLFAKDMQTLDYAWMIERVHRCYDQIWSVGEQILAVRGNVVLDLGFTEKAQRERFAAPARALGIVPEVHHLDAPADVRMNRVDRRNREKDPAVYSFDVTRAMFDFMEPRFEVPDDEEMENGRRIEHR